MGECVAQADVETEQFNGGFDGFQHGVARDPKALFLWLDDILAMPVATLFRGGFIEGFCQVLCQVAGELVDLPLTTCMAPPRFVGVGHVN